MTSATVKCARLMWHREVLFAVGTGRGTLRILVVVFVATLVTVYAFICVAIIQFCMSTSSAWVDPYDLLVASGIFNICSELGISLVTVAGLRNVQRRSTWKWWDFLVLNCFALYVILLKTISVLLTNTVASCFQASFWVSGCTLAETRTEHSAKALSFCPRR